MFTRTGRIATGVALLALAVSACTAGSSTNPGSTGGSTGGSGGGSAGSITIGLVAEPASLDFTTTDGAAIPQVLLGNVYETLVKQDQDGKIVPQLATVVEGVRRTSKTYTFDLVDEREVHQRRRRSPPTTPCSRINRVKTDWTISLKAADGRRRRRQGRVADPAAGDAEQAEQRLAVPDDHPDRRMMFSETGVDALATKPVGTGPYVFERGTAATRSRSRRNAELLGEASRYSNRRR